MLNLEPTDLHHQLQITHQERTQSLLVQLSNIDNSQTDLAFISDFLQSHLEQKKIRGDGLLARQYQIATRKQKQTQLKRYQERIRQLNDLLLRKQQQMWEQTWNGRRVRNISVHRQGMNMFHHQQKQLRTLEKEFEQHNKLKQEIKLLLSGREEDKIDQDDIEYDLRGIDTAVLGLIDEQDQRQRELYEEYLEVAEEFKDSSQTHQDLCIKYSQLTLTKSIPSSDLKHLSPSQMRESSSKTISTMGDQSQF